jgi:hypothetical protein
MVRAVSSTRELLAVAHRAPNVLLLSLIALAGSVLTAAAVHHSIELPMQGSSCDVLTD